MYIYNSKIIATFSKHFYQNVHNPDESLKSFFNYISHLLKISRLTKLRSSMHMSEFKIWKDRRKSFFVRRIFEWRTAWNYFRSKRN